MIKKFDENWIPHEHLETRVLDIVEQWLEESNEESS